MGDRKDDQKNEHGKRRPVDDREQHDDAEAQPESGDAGGQLPTKPGAPPDRDEADELRARAGSEAEFGRLKT